MNSNASDKPLSAPEGAQPVRSLRRLLWNLCDWASALLCAFLAVLLLHQYVFTLARVEGDSMFPTLYDGELLLVSVYDLHLGSIERDDVVICRYPGRGRTGFVKRVVGLPGDTVLRSGGVTHILRTDSEGRITDLELDGLYISVKDASAHDYEAYVLGEDEYFVVGDNRYDSHDSRDWNDDDPSGDVGPITRDMITGHVRRVLWPARAIRPVQ